ncbi:putative membrane protein [Variovorax boronicumulans]|uniref:GNAT family N-acetyltransferase n=1 Tax=Variovorax boronicumulans TaxID=436515 RepID=UPI002787F42F|nr:GNAT family N-acetyltransferase [Variovorax boronicumulans]MDQ0035847.1 putative membrane protein [Variovorax boronicumulans]
MRVEVATPEDAPQIAALGELLHDSSSYAGIPYNRAKVEDLMRNLAAGAGVVFVVRREGEIVGGIAGSVAEWWFGDEIYGFEYSFFMREDARNAFTAIKLVSAFNIWCKARGAKEVRIGVTTGIHQEKTAGFYRLLGFSDIGPLFKKEL